MSPVEGPTGGVSLILSFGPSRGHLVERLRREVGLSPKRFARIARIGSAINPLSTTSPAAIAVECGYADQSHLTHEFGELAGMPPSPYQATFARLCVTPTPTLDG